MTVGAGKDDDDEERPGSGRKVLPVSMLTRTHTANLKLKAVKGYEDKYAAKYSVSVVKTCCCCCSLIVIALYI